ncbi:MAG TPA: hypothetical protein PL029_10760 [Bacteroidia bacterium]|nr:hypothetical protein [Bacteroidia bacterium]
MKNLILILLFSSLQIIVRAQKNQPVSTSNSATLIETETPKIAVITIKFMHAGNQFSVALTNKKILTGRNFAVNNKEWIENDFIAFVLNGSKDPIDTFVIKQPLKVRYEFPKDNGEIGSKVVDLNENEVMLRIPFSSQTKYLSVVRVGEHGKLIATDTLDLQPPK